MQPVSKRNRQVADLLRKEVALLIKHSVSDPRLTSMLITAVDLSSDLSNARVFYTLPDDVNHSDVEVALKKAIGFIRHEISMRTELRYTPQLRFQYDNSIDHAQYLLSLMKDFDKETDD